MCSDGVTKVKDVEYDEPLGMVGQRWSPCPPVVEPPVVGRCPFEVARAAAERDLRLTLDVERLAVLGGYGPRRG
jgi:hypothetical protein